PATAEPEQQAWSVDTPDENPQQQLLLQQQQNRIRRSAALIATNNLTLGPVTVRLKRIQPPPNQTDAQADDAQSEDSRQPLSEQQPSQPPADEDGADADSSMSISPPPVEECACPEQQQQTIAQVESVDQQSNSETQPATDSTDAQPLTPPSAVVTTELPTKQIKVKSPKKSPKSSKSKSADGGNANSGSSNQNKKNSNNKSRRRGGGGSGSSSKRRRVEAAEAAGVSTNTVQLPIVAAERIEIATRIAAETRINELETACRVRDCELADRETKLAESNSRLSEADGRAAASESARLTAVQRYDQLSVEAAALQSEVDRLSKPPPPPPASCCIGVQTQRSAALNRILLQLVAVQAQTDEFASQLSRAIEGLGPES
uniref:TACC_C domain-containing protein n=1 Tax=Macrostomum lignano TaxID=282301 RepID=A0A1I8J457_9PLAT